jgi:hypothetical protein
MKASKIVGKFPCSKKTLPNELHHHIQTYIQGLQIQSHLQVGNIQVVVCAHKSNRGEARSTEI